MVGTRRMVYLAVLSAASFILMYLVEFPLPPFPQFLKYDPGDVPVLLGALWGGPLPALLIQVLKDLMFLLSGKSADGLLGVSANLVAGGVFAVVTGAVNAKSSSLKRVALSLLAGAVAMSLAMSAANYFVFLPLYGVPGKDLAAMAVGLIFPFNLVKGLLSGVLTLLLYPRLKTIAQRMGAGNGIPF